MIYVNEPVFNGNEKKYLNECIESGWISSEGPFVKRFEKEMASFVGRKYATACSSGSAALEMAVSALELEVGSEIILPSMTIISCAQAITKNNLKPVLVDCDLKTFNMNVCDIESKITNKTRAIMVVHIFGITVDMDPVISIAQKYNLKIIEDAAEVHGQTYKGKKCGSFGDISIFSFYPNKHITTGEGGMVLCDEKNIDKRLKSLRNLCFGDDRFVHEKIGSNFRMTNLQAAIGVGQLEYIDEIIQKKRWIGNSYNERLKGLNGFSTPITSTSYCENIYWVYSIVINDENPIDAKDAMNLLKQYGIDTRPFFYPMHLQPVFSKMELFNGERYPNSEKLYSKGFYLPSGLNLTLEMIDEVVKNVKRVLL